ncbi:hypothetical protein NC652_002946 [Populus alba x Populus x berolinensis]|nr:hypothetical protein NC652_002946 [Populus alba x Populus x berolinensis]
MSEQGNLWQKIWNDAPALPAYEQKPLLDPFQGEKLLNRRRFKSLKLQSQLSEILLNFNFVLRSFITWRHCGLINCLSRWFVQPSEHQQMHYTNGATVPYYCFHIEASAKSSRFLSLWQQIIYLATARPQKTLDACVSSLKMLRSCLLLQFLSIGSSCRLHASLKQFSLTTKTFIYLPRMGTGSTGLLDADEKYWQRTLAK